MAIFTNHKVELAELFGVIPEELFAKIARDTQVDYYTKVLYGKVLFYLLLYALLMDENPGQRGIADLYASRYFRALFDLPLKKKISHSSLSERLPVVETDYFKQLYDIIYQRFSALYPARTVNGFTLQRVDSSPVSDVSNRIREGLSWGNSDKKGKMLKYTINFDGMYGSFALLHSENRYTNESLALPENVMEHFKKTDGKSNVYVFDRGQTSTAAFARMKSNGGLRFVGRPVENRKPVVVREFDLTFKKFTCGTIKQDALVQLYGYERHVGKNGKEVKKQFVSEEKYRVIRFRPHGKNEDILLITNILNLQAETIAFMYRRRWDIEVFFRFLKQEVNFSHFIPLNKNGIEVILYMTLITAMLIMIYKKENGIGFKTAKRRIKIELQGLIAAIPVVLTGGDLKKLDFYPSA